MTWTSRYTYRYFHKLSIESKIIKIWVWSKKLWPKHEKTDFCVTPVTPVLYHRLHRCSNFGQMSWSSAESCREFHKLFIEYKIIEIGVRSKELWPKYEALWKPISRSTGTTDDHRLRLCSNFGQMRWSSVESCREFHMLSIEYKIIEIGVRSKELLPKYEVLWSWFL